MNDNVPDDATDLGLEVLWQVFSNLMIDREWSTGLDRGFAWWPHFLRQEIRVTEAFDSVGREVYRITATTDVACPPRLEDRELARRLARLEGVHGTVTFDATDDVIRISSSMTFHDEQADWTTRAFASYAILQAVDAHRCAVELAELLEGTVCTSEHPQSGSREVPDDLLATVVDKVFRVKGAAPSPWSDSPELDQVAEMAPRMGGHSERHDWGITSRLPLMNQSCRFDVRTDLSDADLGAGVTLLLVLPMEGTRDEAALSVFALNELEVSEPPDFHAVGGWQTVQIDDRWWTAYVVFIPAALHQPNVLVNYAMPVMLRSVWLSRKLASPGAGESG